MSAVKQGAPPSNVLFILSGSISAYKACGAVSSLVQRGHTVQAVMTENARRFVGEATLEGLTGRPVAIGMYESGEMLNHLCLARWADLAIVCPATASTICKLAAGTADGLVGAIFLGYDFRKPFLVAPAMNHEMLAHPSVAGACEKLGTFGVQVLETGIGYLSCGEIARGRLLEPEVIVDEVENRLAGNASVAFATLAGTESSPRPETSMIARSGNP